MIMMQIKEDKFENLSEYIEKGLKYLGKAMQCIDELQDGGESRYGNRYGNRNGQGGYGNRWDDDGYDDMGRYGNRQGRGRY